MKKVILIVLSLVFLFSIATASISKKVVEKVAIKDAEKIHLNGELGAGEFRIKPQNMDEALVAEITYMPKKIKYWVDSKIRRDNCFIELGTERKNKRSIDSDENKWDIILSTKYPIKINLDIGACESEFEFGGIPVEELRLDVGAADAIILFSDKNPVRLKEIDIDIGASSLEMENIGNANFDSFNFDGGAGSFNLDFLGEYKGVSYIDIDIGLGSADIVLPKNVPVQIQTDGSNWLSSIDIHNNRLNEIEDDLYESDDFATADNKIILKISVGFGSVDIRFRR